MAALFYVEIVGIKELVVQKLRERNAKAASYHNDSAECDGFVSSVHYALHASVLYPGLLLEPVLRHILFAKKLFDPFRNRVVYSQLALSLHINPNRRSAYIYCSNN